MRQPWLYEHRTNVTSQTGEDGVLEKIFERIGARSRCCVDLGAADGHFISNTYNLVHEHGWSAVLLEASRQEFGKLAELYSERKDVLCLNEFVTEQNSLDHILMSTQVPQDLDLLSIDIDGMDFVIWKALERYRPRVVVIEANASMAPHVHFVQTDPSRRIGSSSRALVDLARQKGYELAAHLVSNCVFVLREEFPKLEIEDNSLDTLFTSPFVPTVVSDLDGVHYLLKEGPWGFSGTVWSNDLKAPDNDLRCAMRSIHQLQGGDRMEVNVTERHGHVAAIDYEPETEGVLRDFVERMRGYHGA